MLEIPSKKRVKPEKIKSRLHTPTQKKELMRASGYHLPDWGMCEYVRVGVCEDFASGCGEGGCVGGCMWG